MTTDEKVMSEAADEIKRLKNEIASFEVKLDEERVHYSDIASIAEERWEDERNKLEGRIEFLEADGARLSALVHPDTPGCDVVAGRCHWCEDVTLKRATRAGLLERERNDYKRQAIEALENLERLTAQAKKVYRLRTEAPAGNNFVEFYASLTMLGHVLLINDGRAEDYGSIDWKARAEDELQQIERRDEDVRALCAAVERVLTDNLTSMPIEVDEALTEALAKVKEGME